MGIFLIYTLLGISGCATVEKPKFDFFVGTCPKGHVMYCEGRCEDPRTNRTCIHRRELNRAFRY